ncbi:MAG: DUF374 domain-containing protein [Candidatus Margulisiibacteriota bacterium]
MKIFQEIIIDIVACLYWIFIILINKTIKVELINEECWEKEERVVFALWHQDTFVPFFQYRYEEIVMFVMESMRGQILGWCARRLGYKTIVLPNDPMAYANAKGVARFVRLIKQGHDGMIAVDGPLGPRHIVKPGIFFISRAADCPIVPCRVVMDKYFTLKTRWDQYIIPWPFCRVRIIFDELYYPVKDDKQNTDLLTLKLTKSI